MSRGRIGGPRMPGIGKAAQRSSPDVDMPKILPGNTLVLPFQGTDVTVTTPFLRLPSGTECAPSELDTLRRIGIGSFGCVILAQQREAPHEQVAVKQLTVAAFRTDEKKKQLLRELDVLKMSDSPFIVQYCGSYFEEGELNLVMEFMDGGSLADLLTLNNGPIPDNLVAHTAYSVVRGLDYLASKAVIHRDVKPSNILATRTGHVKICDFGISGKLELSVVKTRGAFCSIYLCPERLSGKSHAYGVESDVWALGISIVEMAQGSHPLGVDVTMIDVMQRLLHGPPIRLSPDSHPSDACEFVALCLNVDPMRRARKYALLLDHPYLNRDRISESDEMAQWIQSLQPNS